MFTMLFLIYVYILLLRLQLLGNNKTFQLKIKKIKWRKENMM